jgi:putative toxin-antitoxin system antitoxin component (TIGR02293 family)
MGATSKVLGRLQHVAGDLKKLREQSATPGPLGAEVPRTKVRDLPAKELVQLRRQLELSQQQLAHWVNVSLVSVSRWERGQGQPSPREARTLARLAELVAAAGNRLTPKEMTRFFGEPHEDLYHDRPVDVLASEIGYRAVRHLLERLLNAEYA